MWGKGEGDFLQKVPFSPPPHFLLPQYGGMREGVACGEGASLKLADSPIFLDERREKQRIDECGIGEAVFTHAGGVDLHVHDLADELGV